MLPAVSKYSRDIFRQQPLQATDNGAKKFILVSVCIMQNLRVEMYFYLQECFCCNVDKKTKVILPS